MSNTSVSDYGLKKGMELVFSGEGLFEIMMITSDGWVLLNGNKGYRRECLYTVDKGIEEGDIIIKDEE